MIICKTCGKPIRFIWGVYKSSEPHMRIVHESPNCRKRIAVKVNDILPMRTEKQVTNGEHKNG